MPEITTPPPARKARKWLLTQNSQLRAEGIFNWTLPAWAGRFADGRTYNTCPQAGSCVKICYARAGAYRFPSSVAAHQRNLLMIMDTPELWEQQMAEELQHRRYADKWVRLHDSGDFWSLDYVNRWLRLMRGAPQVKFYCYTKSISLFREHVETVDPDNFLWCYSLGGREDHLIDLATERHAEVFPDVETLEAAGYHDQTSSDLLAVLGPLKVGIPANPIPHLKKRLGNESFGSLQRALDARLADKRERSAARASRTAGRLF